MVTRSPRWAARMATTIRSRGADTDVGAAEPSPASIVPNRRSITCMDRSWRDWWVVERRFVEEPESEPLDEAGEFVVGEFVHVGLHDKGERCG